ncbi:MAG TPA: SpvB/TcaC N-terminal domain-containing protein, partial [Polyangiaceae bacterium]|nr:SpvB/TcaC N-terminal domain-containing protein [Polyangiaceae bacterium]
MSLVWFHAHRLPVSAVLLPLFLNATLFPAQALAQHELPPSTPIEAAGQVRSTLEPNGIGANDRRVATALGSERDARATWSVPDQSTSALVASQTRTSDVATTLNTTMPSAAANGKVGPQAISLPMEAATVSGMGESFTAQLTTGTAMLSVPIQLPRARGETQPTLVLGYASAGGYGVAGVGFGLGVPVVARQTDRGTPRYDDRADFHDEQDRFTLGGAELVPICKVTSGACAGALSGEVMPAWAEGWQYFRPRVEGTFARAFWSPDHRSWRVQNKSGAHMELGVPLDGSGYTGALERDPDNPNAIFRWYVVRQYDAHGNVGQAGNPAPVNLVVYRYASDANLAYLTDIYDTPPASNPSDVDSKKFAHHVRLSYETRPDPTSSYVSGWKLEQRSRLASIDITSKPFSAAVSATRELVRRYRFTYDSTYHCSLLTKIQMEGRCAAPIAEDAAERLPTTSCPALPPMEFEYQHTGDPAGAAADSKGFRFEPFQTAVSHLANSPPLSLGKSETALFDVNADGLPDVVVTDPLRYGGKHGLFLGGGAPGASNHGFSAPLSMSVTAAPGADGNVDANVLRVSNVNVNVLDADGDGRAELVHMPQLKTYSVFSAEPSGATFNWIGRAIPTATQQAPKIDFARDARRTALMDVNRDGLVDVVVSSATEMQTYFALGRYPEGDGQFGQATRTGPTSASFDLEPVRACVPRSSIPVRFGDPDVRIADVNGDGLPDIVRIRTGEILYWPGRGNGYWGTGNRATCRAGSFGEGTHVVMANAPRFLSDALARTRLVDLNGDGLADLLQVHPNSVDIYLN